MEEVWKPVVGFDGYEVSNFGNVRSYRKRNSTELYKEPHVIKPPVTGRGGSYNHFFASNDSGKRKLLVHRCVAIAFIDNPKNKPEVNHKDKNGHNNRLGNLEWVTSSENKLHGMGGNKRVPKVGVDRNSYRVFFRNNGRQTSKNFKTKKAATAFASSIY